MKIILNWKSHRKEASKALEKMPCSKQFKGMKLFRLSERSYTRTRGAFNLAAEA